MIVAEAGTMQGELIAEMQEGAETMVINFSGAKLHRDVSQIWSKPVENHEI